MKHLALPALLLAAAALVTTSRAQIVTFDTISEYQAGDNTTGMNANFALSQTMTDVQEITNMTYQFVSTGNSATASSVTAYFVQWNPVTNKPESSTPIFSETFTVPPTDSASWSTNEFADDSGTYSGYDVTLDVDQFLNPTATYAMVLVDTTSGGDIGLMDIGNSNTPSGNPAFYYDTDSLQLGEGYQATHVANLAALTTATSSDQNGSFGFAQLDVVPAGNNLIPLPEPRTAAVEICAAFVLGLVIWRTYQRRRGDSAALPTACA